MTSLCSLPQSGDGPSPAGQPAGRHGPSPADRQRRNSYFEALSSVTSDLNFVASDLRKAQVPFQASSPKSPLAASASMPTVSLMDDRSPVDGHQLMRTTGGHSLSSNNNASTVSAAPAAHYTQLPISRGRDSLPTTASFDKSLVLPVAAAPLLGSFLSPHEGAFNPHLHPGHQGGDTMELSLLTRLVHTKPIWFLPNTPRTAAIHYLQGQPVGTFVVCQARDKDNLVLTMKHPGKGTGLYIEKLPILISSNGVKLSSATEEFPTIEDLILHHLNHEGSLPCKLALPPDITAARNIRALQSLALFEEEFWTRNQSRVSPPEKQGERPKDTRGSPGSSRGHSTLPLTAAEQQQQQVKSSLSSSMAPSLPSPKGYMIMNKQPMFGLHTPVTEGLPSANSNLVSGEQRFPVITMRDRKVDSIAAEHRQLHKSWSFDEKTNPFRQSEMLTMSMYPAKEGQAGSVDDTLLARSGRQPIRCSTQSQQEFLLQNLGHYPPPLHSPPPPPRDTSSNVYPGRPLQGPTAPTLIHRSSAEYYRPFETTRQGHHPPSVFGFDTAPQYQAPPLPPRRSMSNPQGAHYQLPVAGSSLPTNFSNYAFPRPPLTHQGSGDDSSKIEAQLGSLKRTSSLESTAKPSQQYRPTFGSIEGQQNLGPVLQPSISATPPPLPTKRTNPLVEFDPLLASSKHEETPSSSAPLPSQDVFSAPPQPTPPVVGAPDSLHQVSESRYDAVVGRLLNLGIDSSEEEDKETEECKSADKSREEVSGEVDYSSEEWDQMGDDEEEEEGEEEVGDERTRGDRSSSTADTQSSHSSEAHSQIGEHPPQDIKMTTFSDDDHQERNADKFFEISVSQKKKIKKKKKKKASNFSRIQKYVLRSKSKKKSHLGDPTNEIQAAIHKLANNKTSYFSMMMECFVQNIKDRGEQERPDVMIRNIRQFMSGMKNYLFNRREPEVDEAMDKYYNLTMAELDAIVEEAIHSYILLPLKPEIYKCFITDHKESGSLDTLDHNIQLARAKTPEELGIKANYIPPADENLEKIRQYFHQLETAYSPIKKLHHLLDIVRTVYDTVVDKTSDRGQAVQSMGADDFLPMFIYVLVQCEAVNIEIEADYMWGLLEPSLLSGEGGYYLTTLSSAICVLKQFEQETQHTETKGFLSVMVALGDAKDHVVHKTLPVLPGMNSGDVSRILAHKMRIDNAHQYQLYLLTGEEEIPIAEKECPLELKESKSTPMRPCFGYKIEDHSVNWFPSL